MREISFSELKLNPMTMIGGEWWLVAAENENAGYNAMTASLLRNNLIPLG